jgi:hypothetical protein
MWILIWNFLLIRNRMKLHKRWVRWKSKLKRRLGMILKLSMEELIWVMLLMSEVSRKTWFVSCNVIINKWLGTTPCYHFFVCVFFVVMFAFTKFMIDSWSLNINSDFICLVSLICVVFYGWVNFISRNAEITMSNNMFGVWTPVLYFICEFPIACHLFHSHTLS